MRFEPMVKVMLREYQKSYGKMNVSEDEAFEITRDFHKNLENFFLFMPSKGEDYEKIYYERRSKQYADNPTILATQKINFRLLIQSVVAIKIAGFPPDINKEKLIDNYCKKIVDVFSKKEMLKQYVEKAIFCFNKIVEEWVKEKGRSYYHGVKSN